MVQLSVLALEYPRRDLPDSVLFAGPVLPALGPAVALPEWWPGPAVARTVIHVTQGTWDNADLGGLAGPAIRGLADDDVLVWSAPAGARPALCPVRFRLTRASPSSCRTTCCSPRWTSW